MYGCTVLRQVQKSGCFKYFLIRRLFASHKACNNHKSPLQIFRETFKQEWQKSQELQDNIKSLQDASGKLGETEAYRRARDAFYKAQKGSTIVGRTLKKTGEKIEDISFKAWDSKVGKTTRSAINTTARKIDESLEPVRHTKIYRDVCEVIDDSDPTRYGGFISKEERRRRRERDITSGKRLRAIKINEEAGTALVATNKEAKQSIGEKVQDFREKTLVGRKIEEFKVKIWDENQNPLITLLRGISNNIGKLFAETETARVFGQFKLVDPTFNTETFTRHLRNYIVPEVLEAYINGDEVVLKQWFSEAPYNVYAAQQKVFREQGLFSDCKILDIRGVEIVSAKMLSPQDLPALVVSCRVQEIHLYRKTKTGEIAAGHESNIMMSSYAMVLTREPENIADKETEGWKILEFVRGVSRQFT